MFVAKVRSKFLKQKTIHDPLKKRFEGNYKLFTEHISSVIYEFAEDFNYNEKVLQLALRSIMPRKFTENQMNDQINVIPGYASNHVIDSSLGLLRFRCDLMPEYYNKRCVHISGYIDTKYTGIQTFLDKHFNVIDKTSDEIYEILQEEFLPIAGWLLLDNEHAPYCVTCCKPLIKRKRSQTFKVFSLDETLTGTQYSEYRRLTVNTLANIEHTKRLFSNSTETFVTVEFTENEYTNCDVCRKSFDSCKLCKYSGGPCKYYRKHKGSCHIICREIEKMSKRKRKYFNEKRQFSINFAETLQ